MNLTTDGITTRVGKIESTTSIISGNVSKQETRLNTLETNTTASAIITTISKALSGGTGSIKTTKYVMDTVGFSIDAGAFKITDKIGDVFRVRNDGINNCGIELGSVTCKNTPYVDFHSSGYNNDHDARIIAVGGVSGTNDKGRLELRASKIDAWGDLTRNGYSVLSSDGGITGFVWAISYINVNTASNGAVGIEFWRSDASLKTNIVDNQSDSLSKILKIRHREFDWKVGGHVSMGYVSQELQEIDKEFVFCVDQGNGKHLLQVEQSILIPHITRAIQQQQDIIENLKMKIVLLESKLSTM